MRFDEALELNRAFYELGKSRLSLWNREVRLVDGAETARRPHRGEVASYWLGYKERDRMSRARLARDGGA